MLSIYSIKLLHEYNHFWNKAKKADGSPKPDWHVHGLWSWKDGPRTLQPRPTPPIVLLQPWIFLQRSRNKGHLHRRSRLGWWVWWKHRPAWLHPTQIGRIPRRIWKLKDAQEKKTHQQDQILNSLQLLWRKWVPSQKGHQAQKKKRRNKRLPHQEFPPQLQRTPHPIPWRWTWIRVCQLFWNCQKHQGEKRNFNERLRNSIQWTSIRKSLGEILQDKGALPWTDDLKKLPEGQKNPHEETLRVWRSFPHKGIQQDKLNKCSVCHHNCEAAYGILIYLSLLEKLFHIVTTI